jgi:hypothetical protein
MIRLSSIATAQSRRLGNHATLDVSVADHDFSWLVEELTVERLHHHFALLKLDQIRRFELPNLNTLHFVLYGAYASLKGHWILDGRGALLARYALELELPGVGRNETMGL